MYTVSVEATFSAMHHLRMPNGTLEPPHAHDWVVRAHFARPELDDKGMVIDFSRASQLLESALALLDNTDLNDNEAVGGLNPTAEVVARYVYDRISAAGAAVLHRVEVTEAPGCVAAYGPSLSF